MLLPESTLKLHAIIKEVMSEGGQWHEYLTCDLPDGWNRYEDLILFPSRAFSNPDWKGCGHQLWDRIADYLKVSRLARVGGPVGKLFRRPDIEMLRTGDGSTMVTKVENGIRYRWDLLKCMYSPGNTTEKLRIAKFNCQNQVVVDMYAGIGYFTLPYLIKAKAKLLYAIDWNPDAVEALAKNIVDHKCQDRCVIIYGDNRKVTPEGVADHVNLGYIPSCSESLVAACRALNPDRGGILHIHGNCDLKHKSDKLDWLEEQGRLNGTETRRRLTHCLWSLPVQLQVDDILRTMSIEDGQQWMTEVITVFKVKSFGPRVDHIVADIRCVPSHNSTTESNKRECVNLVEETLNSVDNECLVALELYKKLQNQTNGDQMAEVKRKGQKPKSKKGQVSKFETENKTVLDKS